MPEGESENNRESTAEGIMGLDPICRPALSKIRVLLTGEFRQFHAENAATFSDDCSYSLS